MFTLKYSAARLLGAPVIAIGAVLAMSGFNAVSLAHVGREAGETGFYWDDLLNMGSAAMVLGWMGVSGGMFLVLAGLAMVIRPTRVSADESGIQIISPFSRAHYLWEDISGFEKAGWTSLRILLTPTALKLLGTSDPHMPRPPWRLEADLLNRLRAAKGSPTVVALR
ncbi:MAG TPA: hypothetical protein VGO52_11350 [Hyphomonadaceae bacterium]|jgi:hypothetical protein|nr:hypothetical protein [Hyphomonadaceae bacterium]